MYNYFNKAVKISKLNFSSLKEATSTEDKLNNKVHENIATSIYNVIKNNADMCIGIQGGYGSGKSTVIEILKSKIDADNYIFFNFDAWAHEGDCLRRVFLEKLIDCIGINSDNLEIIKDKITNNKITKEITSEKTVTLFGLLLSISLLLLPITKMDFLEFKEPYFLQYISKYFKYIVFFPIILIILNTIFGLYKFRCFSLKYWSFLTSKDTKDIKTEISFENNRDSLEFEKYFKKIMQETSKSIVIAIDNLDRISTNDAIKLWSTLRVFIDTFKKEDNVNGFILVPYDEKSLEKLWENDKSKSFVDKTIELRFDIPDLLMSDWSLYTKELLKENISKLNQQDIVKIIDILRFTKGGLTPREIKIFVRQLMILINNPVFNEISITTKAFYSIIRYIDFMSIGNIKSLILDETEMLTSYKKYDLAKDYFDQNIREQLSGLIYNVSPDTGYELLLSPFINKNFQEGNSKNLQEVFDRNKEPFLIVFKKYISGFQWSWSNILWHSKIIKTLSSELKAIFMEYVKKQLNRNKEDISTAISNYDFIPLFELMKEYDISFDNIFDVTTKQLNNIELLNQANTVSYMVDFINKIYKYYNFDDKNIIIDDSEKYLFIVDYASIELINIINLPEKSAELLQNVVKTNNVSEKIMKRLIKLCQSNIKLDWNEITILINNNVNQNYGYSEIYNELKLLFMICYHKNLIVNLGNYTVNHIMARQQNIYAKMYTVFLMIISKQELNIGYVYDFYDKEKEEIYKIIKDNNLYNMFWKILEHNKPEKFINLAISMFDNHFEKIDFSKNYSLKNLNKLPFDKIKKENFIKVFQKNQNIINSILENDFDIMNYSYLLFLSFDGISNEVLNLIKKSLEDLNEEKWSNSLSNDDYTINIAIKLKEKDKTFNLQNSFMDALIQFDYKKATEYQIENWDKFIGLFTASRKKTIKRTMTNKFINNNDIKFLRLNKNILDMSEIIKHNELINIVLRKSIKEKKLDDIQLIKSLISDANTSYEINEAIEEEISNILKDESIQDELRNSLLFFKTQKNKKGAL